MKSLLLSCALLVTSVSAAPLLTGSQPAATKAASKVVVFFNRQTTFTQLATIKQDLTKDGIVLNYEKLEFAKNGDLLKISFHVDCKDSFSGSASSESLTDEYSFGFLRDYTSNAAKPFVLGKL
jgi:hypothetical protein